MNIIYEFSKVKQSFIKVKEDIIALKNKINDNYDDFIKSHHSLSNEIQNLSQKIHKHIEDFQKQNLNNNHLDHNKHDHKDIIKKNNKTLDQFKLEIKELKNIISESSIEHFDLRNIVEEVNKNKSNINKLTKQLNNGELEIYLLKERLMEKDIEIKKFQQITKHLTNVLGELSRMELEIINQQKL